MDQVHNDSILVFVGQRELWECSGKELGEKEENDEGKGGVQQEIEARVVCNVNGSRAGSIGTGTRIF